MPVENRDVKPVEVLKADMALADLTSGGKLVNDQFKKFYLVLIKGQVMFSRIRSLPLRRETTEINRMTTLGSQVLHPGTEAQALTIAQRVAPGFGQVTLTTKEVVAQLDFPRRALADQVEGPQFRNTLLTYLALHVRRDWENAAINGNTSSTNTLLAMFNGIINGASSNVYPGTGTLSSTILGNTRKTMPSEYRHAGNPTYFTNEVAYDDLWTEWESRGTSLGDAALTEDRPLRFRGKPVVEVPLFPNDLGVGSDETAVMYFDPMGFIFGLEENLEVQSEYNIRERTWTVVMTARFSQGYEYEPGGVVKTTGITGT
jgi:HK97 family phage major capsid protein